MISRFDVSIPKPQTRSDEESADEQLKDGHDRNELISDFQNGKRRCPKPVCRARYQKQERKARFRT
jgi:hypothetical protein